MSRFTAHIVSVAFLASCSLAARGQDRPATLQIDTNAPEADVYVDGSLLGKAGGAAFAIRPGSRNIRLVIGTRYGWSVPPLEIAVDEIAPADTVTLDLDFPYYYRFESTPPHATLILVDDAERVSLGLSPITVENVDALQGRVEFELEGFKKQAVVPGSNIWNFHSVELQPTDPDWDARHLALTRPPSRRKWIDYAAVGTALVAGALAVHYKFKADDRYDRYRETGDPDLRPGIKRYDVYSGVALGVMQAGVGLFAIRLVLR